MLYGLEEKNYNNGVSFIVGKAGWDPSKMASLQRLARKRQTVLQWRISWMDKRNGQKNSRQSSRCPVQIGWC